MTQSESTASAVEQLADRFWESILELNPTTATVYGDERYADRLEDPSPAGRARARRLMEETKAAAEAIPPDGLSVEERITRDVLIVIADQAIEEDDQGTHRLKVVDQISGPQTLLPQVCQFQPADTPERVDKFLARLEAYAPYMAANTDILREGLETGLTAPRIVAERTIAQLERLLAIPLDQAIVPAMAQVTNEADRERVRKVTESVIYPADRAYPRGAPGRLPGGDPRGSRPLVRAERRLHLPDPDPVLDDARARAARRSTRSASTSSRRSTRAAGRSPRRPVPRSPAAYRQRLADDPANTPRTKDELLERAREDIDRAMAVAPRFFGRLPKSGVEVMAVEEFKEKDAPFAYYFPPSPDGSRPRHLLRERLRPAEPEVHEARDDDLPRGRPGPPLPDRPRAGEPGPLDVPPPRRPDRRRRLRRGLGPLQREAGRRDGPVPRRRGAVRDARRGRLAGRPARRRHRPPRPPLVAPAVDRLPARGGPVGDGRDDRDRPLHRLARPGADLHDRLPRDRAAARRARPRGTARGSTCASSTTRCSPTDRCRSRRCRASCRTG